MAKTDVLVVGAGPAGLIVANLLVRYGVRVRVIDSAPGHTVQSRASLVHIRTLELWDKLGLAAPAVEHGQRLVATRLWANGKVLADLPLSGRAIQETPYPFALGYEQWKTQRMLADALAEAAPTVTVEWGTRLVDLEQNSQGVGARVVCADGTEQKITATWGIGADGANSAVRRLLGVAFEGSTYGQVGFLADVDMEFGVLLPDDRVNIFVAPVGTVGFVKFHDSGHSQYRLYGTVTAGLQTALEAQRDGGVNVSVRNLQRWFDEQFLVPARIHRCEWYYSHRFHSKIAARFRDQRWFLVGDAAHVHPPSGGQGANLSMGDAYNLGWKLGAVVAGQAEQGLLESYETERRSVAMSILAGSKKGFMLEAATPAWRRARQWLLPMALRIANKIPVVRDAPSMMLSQQWVRYRASPVVAGTSTTRARLRPGDRAPDAMLAEDAEAKRLFDVLHGVDHHLLVLQGNTPTTRFAELASGVVELSTSYRVAIQVHTLGREHVELHQVYQVGEAVVVLVRPDGHIGYQGPLADLPGLRGYLDCWYAATSGSGSDSMALLEAVEGS
jgi:2-polyprenyl-6-methoxyphenol hydroxylase-like FAD-dependent oxidoreductase